MTKRPSALVVTGPPGSGKSTTGVEIARQLGAALLDLDSLTNPLVDVVLDVMGGDGYDDPRVAPLIRSARYEGLLRGAKDCLLVGTPVVLVAPFSAERRDPGKWAALARLLDGAGGQPDLVFLSISRTELAARLLDRGATRDASKLADLETYLDTLDLSAPASPHLVADASVDPRAQALEVLRHLGAEPRSD